VEEGGEPKRGKGRWGGDGKTKQGTGTHKSRRKRRKGGKLNKTLGLHAQISRKLLAEVHVMGGKGDTRNAEKGKHPKIRGSDERSADRQARGGLSKVKWPVSATPAGTGPGQVGQPYTNGTAPLPQKG